MEEFSIRNPVLIIVDVQNGFLNEHSSHVIPSIERLIDESKSRGIHIVLTKFVNAVGSPFERLMNWQKVREEPEIDLYGPFIHKADLIIEKHLYSPFSSGFVHLVSEHGWETIIICGISTESCILKTAVDTFERGLTPIVVSDACASDLGPEMHRAGLSVIEVLVGTKQMVSVEELFTKLDLQVGRWC